MKSNLVQRLAIFKNMNFKQFLFGSIIICLLSCNFSASEKNSSESEFYAPIKIVGAMKNALWKGEIGSRIDLDTISDKEGLYGIGPVSYLKGEILINNGRSYVSKVTSDSTMVVEETFEVSAPFFVYGNVVEWHKIQLPAPIKTIPALEKFINEQTTEYKRPFAFKLTGYVSNATIHIQNLPKGTIVTSPEVAHQGQVKFRITNEEVEIIGFFSTEHKGIFTHHDSFVHLHLISKDKNKMGHVEDIEISAMELYLPKR